MKLEAHAKLNLTLEVLGKRPDGYHNLVSIMQTIDLHWPQGCRWFGKIPGRQ